MSDSRQRPVIQNRILLLLVALTLIRGLIYVSVTPPWWQGHDEDFHFTQSRSLIDQWASANSKSQYQNWPQEMTASFAAFPASRWSRGSEYQPNLVNLPARHTRLTRHSLSYYVYAWPGQLLIQQDILFQLFALRIVSVLMTCGTIIFAFLSARQLFPGSLMAQILTPWLILFNPSFMIINSAINDGNLTVLLSTVIFYLLLLEIAKQHIGWRSALALGLTFLALWSKATAFFLIVVWGVLLFVLALKIGRKAWLWLVVAGGLLFTSLFLLPAYFQGKLTTIWTRLQSGEEAEGVAYVLSFEYFRDTFAGFWVILGYFVYYLNQNWYVILFLFSLLAMIGLFIYAWRSFKKNGLVLSLEQKSLLFTLLFAGVAIAELLGLGILRYDIRTGRLARYMFPAIVPLSILMVTGWRALLPTNWRNVGFLFIAGGLFLFDTMVWLNYALPWYYPFWPH